MDSKIQGLEKANRLLIDARRLIFEAQLTISRSRDSRAVLICENADREVEKVSARISFLMAN